MCYIANIVQVFPESRIVFAQRDALDTCFSCFATNFAGAHEYTCDLGGLGRYYRRLERLTSCWHAAFPLQTMLLSYEELVERPEEVMRVLVDFCGLPWSDDYAAFHRQRRDVRTASYHQVVQPLYRSAVKRAEKFRPWLQPLLAALEDET